LVSDIFSRHLTTVTKLWGLSVCLAVDCSFYAWPYQMDQQWRWWAIHL